MLRLGQGTGDGEVSWHAPPWCCFMRGRSGCTRRAVDLSTTVQFVLSNRVSPPRANNAANRDYGEFGISRWGSTAGRVAQGGRVGEGLTVFITTVGSRHSPAPARAGNKMRQRAPCKR